MESPGTSPLPSSNPRVCAAIAHPDSSSPSRAVLRLAGCADPSAAGPHPASRAIDIARTSPSSTPFADRAPASPIFLASSATDAPKRVMAEMDADEDSHSKVQGSISPECSSAGDPSPQGSSTHKALCVDNPSPRGSCVDSGSCSSFIKGFDKKAVSIRPSLMKKCGSTLVCANGVVVKKCTKSGSGGVTISVSHTEKETIVHTDTSNFREVVHQLTGASRSDNVLLPVTMPSRTRGVVDEAFGCSTRHDGSSKGPSLGPHKLMPPRLFERRRSSKTLEKLSTSCKDLPPLVPSPVTPLASDFERICLPVTPVASPVTGKKNESSKHMLAMISLNTFGSAPAHSGHRHPGANNSANLEEPHTFSQYQHSIAGLSRSELNSSCGGQQEKSFEDLVIAEKGFFLHPQRPKTSEPALLPLFPESPRDQ